MARDRLNELNQKGHKEKKRKSAVIDVPEENNESNNLKYVFDCSNVIKSWIEKIENNNENIKRILATKDTINYHKKETQNELDALFTNNTNISNQCLSKLKSLEDELQQHEDKNAVQVRIKTIQHSTCKTQFHKALQQNNELMEAFQKHQTGVLMGQLKAKCIEATEEEMRSLLNGELDFQIFTDNILAETAEAKRLLADIEDRHAQLLKIEQMLHEVRDLFLQTSILIDHQSELLNRIEYQAQIATDAVHAVDLESARKSKAKSFKLKLIIVAILVVILVILLVSIFK